MTGCQPSSAYSGIQISEGGFAFLQMGNPDAQTRLVWAHGWGQDHRVFLGISQSFYTRCDNVLLDLPGFGSALIPPPEWGTAEYADAAAKILEALPPKKTIWIGHSYGCRIGIQLAVRHPHVANGLLLIAAAGLPRRLSFLKNLQRGARIVTFKILKTFVTNANKREQLRSLFGSPDYRSASYMRKILVKAVNEDLSNLAARITCPVSLVYGSQDQDTPPEIGERYKRIIINSEMHIINGFDHHSILTDGKHQVAMVISNMLDGE